MAQPLGIPYSYFADADGAPLAGGKVYTYLAGTTTPQAAYTDSTLTVPLANPVILDSAGRATIWLSGFYKIVVTDASDVLISTTDNITATGSGGDMTKAVYDPINIAQQLVGLTANQVLSNKTLAAPNIIGVSNGSAANSGSVGEVISSAVASGAGVALSTTVTANVTSISLTAGDWDVWGEVGFLVSTSTTPTFFSGGINTTSASIPDPITGSNFALAAAFTASVSASFSAGKRQISVATTTTVYLVALANFGTSTMKAYGGLYARRIR